MKRHHLFIFFFLPLLLFGCSDEIFDSTNTVGNTTLTLSVDLLKYLDNSQKSIEYGRDPVIPGDLGTFELQTPSQGIDLSGELEDVNTIESVEMRISVAFHNETGTADLTYSAYLSGMDDNPYDTPPIIAETVSLNGAEDTTSDIVVESDQRLLDLFEVGIMQYGAEVLFEISAGSDNVSGEAEVVRFDVTIVTTL